MRQQPIQKIYVLLDFWNYKHIYLIPKGDKTLLKPLNKKLFIMERTTIPFVPHCLLRHKGPTCHVFFLFFPTKALYQLSNELLIE